MKVGIDARLLTHPQVGGFKTYTTNLISALGKIDHENDYIIYTDRHASEVDLPKASNFTYRVVDGSLPIIGMPLREQMRLRRQILSDKPDIVHFLCNTATVNLPIRYIVTLHDTIQLTSNNNLLNSKSIKELKICLLDIYSKWTINRSIPNAARVITVSNFEKSKIGLVLGLKNNLIAVTHLATNEIFTQADNLTKAKWRTELLAKYNINEKFLLGIGYEARKNIRTIIEAFSRVTDQFPELILVIIAANEYQRDQLKSLARSLNIENKVNLLPAIAPEELVKFYNLAAIYIFPSMRESFGLPPLEAMACGTPVIAANNSSIPEVVGNAAVLVDPTSGESLAEAMLEILTDASMRAELTHKGLKRVASFSWEKCARQTIQVYQNTIDKSEEKVG